jgi:hypothetical protein
MNEEKKEEKKNERLLSKAIHQVSIKKKERKKRTNKVNKL